QILREKARDTDVVARYGGGGVAIIMPGTDANGAQGIAERIRETVQRKGFLTQLGALHVTPSPGLAPAPEHGTPKQALIDLADQCLYVAKRGGRNRTVLPRDIEASRARAGETGRGPSGSAVPLAIPLSGSPGPAPLAAGEAWVRRGGLPLLLRPPKAPLRGLLEQADALIVFGRDAVSLWDRKGHVRGSAGLAALRIDGIDKGRTEDPLQKYGALAPGERVLDATLGF